MYIVQTDAVLYREWLIFIIVFNLFSYGFTILNFSYLVERKNFDYISWVSSACKKDVKLWVKYANEEKYIVQILYKKVHLCVGFSSFPFLLLLLPCLWIWCLEFLPSPYWWNSRIPRPWGGKAWGLLVSAFPSPALRRPPAHHHPRWVLLGMCPRSWEKTLGGMQMWGESGIGWYFQSGYQIRHGSCLANLILPANSAETGRRKEEKGGMDWV